MVHKLCYLMALSRFQENKPSAAANPFIVISSTNAWLSRCLQYILTYISTFPWLCLSNMSYRSPAIHSGLSDSTILLSSSPMHPRTLNDVSLSLLYLPSIALFSHKETYCMIV